MGEPSRSEIESRLAETFVLDQRWRTSMGLPAGDTKERALHLVTDLLEREGVPYAVIGGLALQLHSEEPRTTIDIDVAIKSYDAIPAQRLREAGFEHVGRFAHSDNWLAPGPGAKKSRTPIQFMADPLAHQAVDHAQLVVVRDLRLRLATAPDLVTRKLQAAEDPSRPASKRVSDLPDILRLLEDHPDLRATVPELSRRLAGIQERILGPAQGR
jgi:hypothetical protein